MLRWFTSLVGLSLLHDLASSSFKGRFDPEVRFAVVRFTFVTITRSSRLLWEGKGKEDTMKTGTRDRKEEGV